MILRKKKKHAETLRAYYEIYLGDDEVTVQSIRLKFKEQIPTNQGKVRYIPREDLIFNKDDFKERRQYYGDKDDWIDYDEKRIEITDKFSLPYLRHHNLVNFREIVKKDKIVDSKEVLFGIIYSVRDSLTDNVSSINSLIELKARFMNADLHPTIARLLIQHLDNRLQREQDLAKNLTTKLKEFIMENSSDSVLQLIKDSHGTNIFSQ